jgi:hypothetical protein
MLDRTKVSGEIAIADAARERVAYDLARLLGTMAPDQQDRFLELYARCLITMTDPTLGVATIQAMAQGNGSTLANSTLVPAAPGRGSQA